MNYVVVIPSHNEQDFIGLTLRSLLNQSHRPAEIVVVNDNSTDQTEQIIHDFTSQSPLVKLVNLQSNAEHLPGSKVIHAFNAGFETLKAEYDIVVKLDADLILPQNYFEVVVAKFASDTTIGVVGGFAYIESNGNWVLENLTDNDHIRGAFKAYRKQCFEQIGGVKPAMGWDTVDELLARFYDWKVVTIPELHVKHLKPTGKNYNTSARYKQGEAFYSLGYGFLITAIASVKLAWLKKKPLLFIDYIKGFYKAKNSNKPLLVTPEQARFIRRYRLQKMKSKLF